MRNDARDKADAKSLTRRERTKPLAVAVTTSHVGEGRSLAIREAILPSNKPLPDRISSDDPCWIAHATPQRLKVETDVVCNGAVSPSPWLLPVPCLASGCCRSGKYLDFLPHACATQRY